MFNKIKRKRFITNLSVGHDFKWIKHYIHYVDDCDNQKSF